MGKKPRKSTAKKRAAQKPARPKPPRVERSVADGQRPEVVDRQASAATAVPALTRRPVRGTSATAVTVDRERTTIVPADRRAVATNEPRSEDVMASPAQAASGGCAGIDDAEPQGLAATYWFDAPASPEPYSVAIRFVGVRNGVKGKPGKGDRFERVERVDGIPGGGRVAITTRPSGINSGEWRVSAAPLEQRGAGAATTSMPGWLPRRVLTARTRLALLAQGPAVRLTSWPALVGLGAAAAIAIQALLVARAGLGVGTILTVSLIATVLGFVGGKAYYLVLKRKHPREFLKAGACIQGFLLVALGVVAVGAAVFRFPVGVLLDVTAPGVFLGMAIGRPGCFLTGCCYGRPTDSRWGLWSSDRRVAIRRFPVQLLEAAMALLIGGASLLLVLTVPPPIPGAIFIGTVAVYTLGRQFLFPLRSESHTPAGRAVTMALCGFVVVGVTVGSIVA